MAKREWASHDQDFIRNLTKAGISINSIYDIGASNGIWSWLMAKVVPHAAFNLFEPLESDQYAKDLANVLQDRPDFRMHRIALGDEETTLHLNLHREHVGSTLIALDWEGIVAKKAVPVRRLDDVVSTLKLPPADLIKMDVQGFELKILAGAEISCRRAKALMIETWLYRDYGPSTPLLGEIIDWMASHDFKLVSLGDTYVAPDMKLSSVDAFFLRDDLLPVAAKSGVTLMGDAG
jgi:FkbM family methyltransferase